jgi:hypothetical protein
VELTADNDPHHAVLLISLGNSQQIRFKHLGELPDFAASVTTFKVAAQSEFAYPRHALGAARKWAKVSH